MNDQELADKIVASGVGKCYGPTETQSAGFSPPRDGTEKLYVYSAHHFVRDWRVAGAMIEKCVDLPTDPKLYGQEDDHQQILLGRGGNGFWCDFPATRASLDINASNESFPRAINETCAKALDGEST